MNPNYVTEVAEENTMPYTFVEKGEEPQGALLRRRDIQRWLGISNWSFYQAVNAGLLSSKRLLPGGVRYYQREEVERVFLNGFRTSSKDPEK
jgi:hypothetical protein